MAVSHWREAKAQTSVGICAVRAFASRTHTYVSKLWFRNMLKPVPEAIKLFSCSIQLSTKFQRLIKTKIPIYADVSCF